MNIRAHPFWLGALAITGSAIVVGVLIAFLDTQISPWLVLIMPAAMVAIYVIFRYPVSLVVILFVAWCTAPAFEWIELGTVGGFTLRPDYIAIVLMTALLLVRPRSSVTARSFPTLRRAIWLLIAAEFFSLVVDTFVSGDIRLLLLLGIKTIGAGVGYEYLRSRLSQHQLVTALKVFIGLAIIPLTVSILVGVTRSTELFDMFLKGSGTQAEFSTPFGVVPRAFLLGAEPYLLAVFALCLVFALGPDVSRRVKITAILIVMVLILRLPFTWARNLIATYGVVFGLAILAGWFTAWLRVSRKARLIQLGLVVGMIVVGLMVVQSVPQLQEALDFTTGRFASIESDLDPSLAGARYVGASLAVDALSNDPTALIAGNSDRQSQIGFEAIPVSDIATPVAIMFKFGILGLIAVLYVSWTAFQAGRRGVKGNVLVRQLAGGLLLTLAGLWFQTLISASAFVTTPYATILILGILFTFLELAARREPNADAGTSKVS